MATKIRSEETAGSVPLAAVPDNDMREDYVATTMPDRYVYRDISFGVDLYGGLQFGFRNDDRAQPLASRTIEQVVDTLPAPGPLFHAAALATPTQTPLDLEVWGSPIYIIFRIAGPTNMTFHPTRKAVAHKALGPRDRYGLLKHRIASGHSSAAGPDCKVIYFACVPGNVDPYADGLDLRVRLKQQAHLGPPQVDRILDIDIDPDIRFPGGSPT